MITKKEKEEFAELTYLRRVGYDLDDFIYIIEQIQNVDIWIIQDEVHRYNFDEKLEELLQAIHEKTGGGWHSSYNRTVHLSYDYEKQEVAFRIEARHYKLRLVLDMDNTDLHISQCCYSSNHTEIDWLIEIISK